jgi:WD40 repeat protein
MGTVRLRHGGLNALAFSADGATLATGGTNTIRLWDVKTARELHSVEAHTGEVNAVAVSPDGKLVASGSWEDYTVRVWERASGRALRVFTGHTAYVRAVAFSADGRTVVSGGGDGTVRLWDATSGQALRTLTVGGGGEKEGVAQVFSLLLSADGKTLAAVSMGTDGRGYSYWAWDLARTGNPVKHDLGDGGGASYVFIAPDARTVALADGQRVLLREVATGKDREFRGSPCLSWPVVFSPDSKWLAAKNEGPGPNSVSLWDLAAGKRRVDLKTGHVGHFAFSPDGRYIATAGPDVLRLWEVATGQEVLRHDRPEAFKGHHGYAFASSLAFTPDGRGMVTGLPDTTLLLWELAPAKATAKVLKPEDLDRLWKDLAEDGPKSYAATWVLAQNPSELVMEFLKERLPPAVAPDGACVRKLILDLDSDEFRVRTEARRPWSGSERGRAAAARLADKPSAQVRGWRSCWRDHGVLNSAEVRRGVRAVEVLERVGSPAARQILADLKRGSPEVLLTREAKAALARLEK